MRGEGGCRLEHYLGIVTAVVAVAVEGLLVGATAVQVGSKLACYRVD